MTSWYYLPIGALGLALLMVAHEAGHFFVARAFGMRVTRFSIGFGPTLCKVAPKDGFFWFTTAADKVRLRLWKHDPVRSGPTVYQVAMIPFLAYVQIAGMNPLEEVEPEDKGSYANASLLGRTLTIFAGPAASYLFASVLYFVALFFGGRPVQATEVSVVDNGPAAVAHMKSGDKIVEIDGVPITEWGKMRDTIASRGGQTIPIVVERGGARVLLQVTPANVNGKGMIQVAWSGKTFLVPVTTKEATVFAIKRPAEVVRESVIGIGQLLTGKADGELSGPVGIVRESAKAAKEGWNVLVMFLGMLSAYFGVFNLVPFPGLDGARLMFLTYEATTRRRPNAKIEAHIHLIGLAMMLSLMTYITLHNDLGHRGSPAPAPAPSAPQSGSSAPASGK